MSSSFTSPAPTGDGLSPDPIAAFVRTLSLRARVVLPSDPGFAAACESWNHDLNYEKPSFVIICAGVADVVLAVNYVRTHRLPFTVAGGRHSRYSSRADHVMISLGGMRSVHVDPVRSVAYIEGGARNGDLDHECSLYNLHTVAGTNPDTGCGGLMLGGGVGYLSRLFGLSIDQFVELEVVTWEGKVIRVSDKEHEDLFWGMKGAGFNFGITTKFCVKLHPVGHKIRELTPEDQSIAEQYQLPEQAALEHMMSTGVLIYPVSRFHDIFTTLQDKYLTKGTPDDDRNISIASVLGNGPHGPCCIVQWTYTGDIYRGFQGLERFKQYIGEPLVNTVHPKSYLALQQSLDALTPAAHWYERVFITERLTTELCDVLLASFKQVASIPGAEKCAILSLLYGNGAVADNIGNGCFSSKQRTGSWLLAVLGYYDPLKGGTRQNSLKWNNDLRANISPHCLTQYTNSSNGMPGARVLFDDNLQQLRILKQKYDPNNFFCNNHNIVPADATDAEEQVAEWAG